MVVRIWVKDTDLGYGEKAWKRVPRLRGWFVCHGSVNSLLRSERVVTVYFPRFVSFVGRQSDTRYRAFMIQSLCLVGRFCRVM